MKVSRSIRKEWGRVILIAFAAAMLAVYIPPALAAATYLPPDPTNLTNTTPPTNTTGRFWVNYSWTAGEPGNATDSYNVSVNETWTNGTTNTSINETVSSSVWVNITVWAWNASGTGTLSADCISDSVQARQAGSGSTFGLVGSVPTGGGGGTYPPGWFETPAPAVTATKAPTPSATATATAASPGDKVTPAPTKKPAAAKTDTPAAKETAAGKPAKGAPGFTAVFVIAGLLAVAYAMMRRRE
jgi:PGF-CTERM protein